MPLVVLLRRAFEQMDSYAEAKAFLENTPQVTPIYHILGGVSGNDGCIITSDGSKGPVENFPNTTLEEMSNHGEPWVLQTNYDQGQPDPYWDPRATAGNQCFRWAYGKKASGQSAPSNSQAKDVMSFASMYDILSTKPVYECHTAHTTLMEVRSGKMETWLRGCDPACKLKSGPPLPPKNAAARLKSAILPLVIVNVYRLTQRYFQSSHMKISPRSLY